MVGRSKRSRRIPVQLREEVLPILAPSSTKSPPGEVSLREGYMGGRSKDPKIPVQLRRVAILAKQRKPSRHKHPSCVGNLLGWSGPKDESSPEERVCHP